MGLLLHGASQRSGYFLQSVVAEVAFGGAARQINSPAGACRAPGRQSADLERNVLGRLGAGVVGKAAQSLDLIAKIGFSCAFHCGSCAGRGQTGRNTAMRTNGGDELLLRSTLVGKNRWKEIITHLKSILVVIRMDTTVSGT